MPLPTATTKIIAGGAWAKVRVKVNDVLYTIGMASNASYSENFALQDANVIGHLGPISIDSQGYQCTVSVGAYVPENASALGSGNYPDGGDITMNDLLPSRQKVQLDGKGRTFDYLDFYNEATGKVIVAFAHVIVADNGVQINPNAYITQNIQLRAIERTNAGTTGTAN